MANNEGRKTRPYGALVSPGHARLTVVSGLCPEGITFSIGGSSARVGRGDADICFAEDTEVSPQHATLSYQEGRLVVRDDDSLNGVYLRIRGPHVLHDGDWFRVGDQYFRFHPLQGADQYPTRDGTHYFTSPRRKGTFRIQQVLSGGHAGMSSTTSNDELLIGGEGATVAFSADAHLSHRHARVYRASSGSYMIEDTGSVNGTFIRIRGEHALSHGDLVFVGHQLLRVDIT